MHLKTIKVFCDIVQQRSFSRAADENAISQSGASQLVHQLEQRLAVKLIDRSKRPFVLTPEGEAYYEGCRGLVESYLALEDRVRTLHQQVAGRVRVASIYSVGLHLMRRHLQEFMTRYPRANVRLEYLHPHRVYQAVEGDKADLGLVSYPRASRTIEAIHWRDEPMVLVCAPQHRLADRRSVSLEDLHGENLVSFDQDLTIRHEIDRVLQSHGVQVRVPMEFDNIETIKRAIEIDAGMGLLPEPTVTSEVASGALRAIRLETQELVRPLGIVHRRGRELPSAAWKFIELLQLEGARLADGNGGRTTATRAPGAATNGDGDGTAHVQPAGAGDQTAPGGSSAPDNGHGARRSGRRRARADQAVLAGGAHGRQGGL
jgi:DNA-binding transcriptional LysR family regulator